MPRGTSTLTFTTNTALKVGGILELQATTRTRVRLECNAEPLFWCSLGQGEGFYTLRIDESVSQEQEFIDDVLSR